MPSRFFYDIFHGNVDDMRQISFAGGYAVSDTCGWGLRTAFVEWSRIGWGEMERSRQQRIDLDTGEVHDVRVPETPDTCGEVVEMLA